jgi:ATP-dependent Clp protease ATP-binding subunit ClpA
MFDIFTEQARTVIVEAQAEAQERQDATIATEHLLLGLLREGTGLAGTVLTERAVTLDGARTALDALIGPRPPTDAADAALATIGIDLAQVQQKLVTTFGDDALAPPPTPFDEGAKEALQAALTSAEQLAQDHVGTEHELLGILAAGDGHAPAMLEHLGLDLTALADELRTRAG